MLRVTADTNIYISALQFKGQPLRLLGLAGEGRIVLTISTAILQEIAEVLRDKFGRNETDIRDVMQGLSRITQFVEPTEPIYAIKDDADDNMVLECAVAGRSDLIVSGDRHLLSLRQYGSIRIVKLTELLTLA